MTEHMFCLLNNMTKSHCTDVLYYVQRREPSLSRIRSLKRRSIVIMIRSFLPPCLECDFVVNKLLRLLAVFHAPPTLSLSGVILRPIQIFPTFSPACRRT